MIKATELRLGNYVRVNSTIPGPIAAVTAISENHITTDTMGRVVLGRYIEPIPLTPEILEAAGFEYGESDWWAKVYHSEGAYESFNVSVNLKSGNAVINEVSEDFYAPSGCPTHPIKYLHQLQNLIFTLTGEELTIKNLEPWQNTL